MPKNSYYVSSFSLFDELPSLFGASGPNFFSKVFEYRGFIISALNTVHQSEWIVKFAILSENNLSSGSLNCETIRPRCLGCMGGWE